MPEFLIVTPQARPGVALLQLNRPKELNALNLALMHEIRDALGALDADAAVRAVVITGHDRAFAAGADIRAMAGKSPVDMLLADHVTFWDQLRLMRKPLVAAVAGFALGGGCELALACDLIVAAETAQFGQPEIRLGTLPGGGGTQRLARAVGKAKAMEMVLTGDFISAAEALRLGLVNRVVPAGQHLEEAFRLAARIAAQPPVAVRLAKEAVNFAFESHLAAGLQFERRNYYLTFASEDQREGMAAFLEKRPPAFTGR